MPSKAKPIQMNTTYNVGGAVPRPSNPQANEIMAKQQSKRGGMTPGRTGGQTLRTQGPKRRSLRDIATRRKKMKAFAEKQKTMLASGRTKKTTPTPSTKVRPVAGVSGNSQFNAAQSNALEQFNVGEVNSIAKFNEEQNNAREEFNTKNALIIAQANAQWRQATTTTNTAAQNEANMQDAKTMNAFTASTLDQVWQRERDLLSYTWQANESSLKRINDVIIQNILATSSANNTAATNAANVQSAAVAAEGSKWGQIGAAVLGMNW